MKRTIILFLAVFTLLTAHTPQTADANLTKGASAVLTSEAKLVPQKEKDNRAEILEAYLESYNSPLAPHAKTFIEEADKNNLDWRLVPAITGLESYFGQMIPPYSNNGWGYGVYGNNVRRFATWDEGIQVVTTALRKEYIDTRGARNVYEIGATYAADPNWANKVIHYMDEIDAFVEKAESKPTISLSL
jgi:hypothetical protein